jgi:AAA+ ATPase superfamily predicted ATPase
MNTLVDRESEIEALLQAASSLPSLVVLYGRRRVGKSSVVNAAFTQPATAKVTRPPRGSRVIASAPPGRAILHQADEQPEAAQLATFARDCAALTGLPGMSFQSWDAALDFVRAHAIQQPGLVVVLDEFQYLCLGQPALPSIIQKHWDAWERGKVPVMLVLVGSAITFMEGLLPVGAPLHGRASLRPRIDPLTYHEAAGFASQDSSPQALVERYAVVGGTPQYQLWAGTDGVAALVKRAILTKGVPLYEEPLQLIRAEESVQARGRYYAALAAIASGRTRTGEVAAALEAPTSNAVRILDRLQELRYVQLLQPLSFSPKRSRAYWRVSDPFFNFWFRWVFPNHSRLEQGRIADVWADIAKNLDAYVGPIFEDCCRDWLGRYSEIDEARTALQVGRWWSRDGQVEIDVVATTKTAYTLLGSCKWHRGKVGTAVLDQLYEHKGLLGKQAAQARLALFSRDGFHDDVVDRAASENVILITTADLFGHA